MKNAIILAAGLGMRMVPINTMYTKGMLEVHHKPLIERLICQLHEAGVEDIKVVVGFMKESYDYLIDKYDVNLIVNSEYIEKNNLYSLYLAEKYIKNTYIIPCDVWCKENPFSRQETDSWYMISTVNNSGKNINVKKQVPINFLKEGGNKMIGIAYISEKDALFLKNNIRNLVRSTANNDRFWEDALIVNDCFMLSTKTVSEKDVVEINTYEQLRDLDNESNHLKSNVISLIAKVLQVDLTEIKKISVLKKGMTNRSFLFTCKNERFIMRIPGEGTDSLINRCEEAVVYKLINNKHLCDDVIYINPENGYKRTKYLNNARICDANSISDLKLCMKKLRWFHNQNLIVDHEFDVFHKIEFYESLWKHKNSMYKDYTQTKANIMSLKLYIENQPIHKCLSHIDAVPDNFLFYKDEKGNEHIRLIDWEYSAMQDPHIDIAMFCIYALYKKNQIDQLIDIYFENQCDENTRTKIYCYVAICGLLWSNWCEYKFDLGVEFGEYSLYQYRYAKDYYKIAMERINRGE